MTYADSGNKGAFDFTTARTNAFSRSVACTFLLVIGWLWKWTSPTTPILARIDAHAETQVVTSTWQLRRSTGDFHGEDHGGPIDARWEEQHSAETTEHDVVDKDATLRASPKIRRVLSSSTNHDHPHHHHSHPGEKMVPIMHTFYIPIEDKKETGMSKDSNQKLIEAWTEEWRRHGCEARVIGMETAQQHPDFEHYNMLLDGLNLSTYERYCFLRYLAMAVVSGGWMCDYDTFPLHPHDEILPNGGVLTVHEYTKNGGVPSLISGSKDEFNRIAALLINNAVLHKSEASWSDMFALHDEFVSSGGTSFMRSDPTNVIPFHVVAKQTQMDRICKRTNGKYAIHFSRFAIEQGAIEGAGPEQRAEIAQEWLKTWRSSCMDGETESG